MMHGGVVDDVDDDEDEEGEELEDAEPVGLDVEASPRGWNP